MTSTGVDVKECIQSKGDTIPVTPAECDGPRSEGNLGKG